MNGEGRPAPIELTPYYQTYVDRCSGENLFGALLDSLNKTKELAKRIPEDLGEHRYAPDKWSVKDVVQHMIDTERIFAYRALRFARNDRTELPGFEENDYALHTNTKARRIQDLFFEAEIVRGSSILLFQGFSEEMFLRQGTANGNPFSVRALGWIIAGHHVHHINVINERYLSHANA
ncbi:MAG: DinB family protein [Flavobacteriales bacterium]|nr:DinB family protein [Flavobacteriales bacterium]